MAVHYDTFVQEDEEITPPAAILPPTDDGKEANLVLLGCSILQLPIWGFAGSYGVFQVHYTSSPFDLRGDLSQTGIIGTTLNGIIYLSMPLLFGLFTNPCAHLRKQAAVAGALISGLSLILSSFSQEIWHLVLCQGVLQALGCTLLFSSTTIYLDEWFVKRKGLAFGLVLSVKAAGGVGTPLLFGYLLSRWGFRMTLRIWATTSFVVAVSAISLLRSRNQPINEAKHRSLSWSFLRRPMFYVFQTGNIIFSASYGMPQTYLSSFAADVFGLPPSSSALLMSTLNAPSIIASFWFGMLSDGNALWRGGPSPSISKVSLLSALGSSIPVFLFWGLASPQDRAGLPLLSLFAVVYGFFAGGYSATWGGIVKELAKEEEMMGEDVDTAMIYGLLNGGRGIGYLIGGLFGVKLFEEGPIGTSQWAYGTQYGSVILFTGVGAALGGIGILLKPARVGRNVVREELLG